MYRSRFISLDSSGTATISHPSPQTICSVCIVSLKRTIHSLFSNEQLQKKSKLIWDIADLLRGDYKPREYVDVILPMTVFRRLDQAMEERREAV